MSPLAIALLSGAIAFVLTLSRTWVPWFIVTGAILVLSAMLVVR